MTIPIYLSDPNPDAQPDAAPDALAQANGELRKTQEALVDALDRLITSGAKLIQTERRADELDAQLDAAKDVAEAYYVELQEAEKLQAQLAALTAAAHMPADYPHGLPSWINQRLYRTYIEQGKDQAHWDALTAALDARDKAEAQLAEAHARAERWKTLAGQSAMSDFNNQIDNKTLRAALEAVEWSAFECPSCHAAEEHGHKDGCALQAALKQRGEVRE